ncbi:translocation/assembly module TamB domain-containing protein [Rivibacter subsaxonicus]|uniref:Translocation and assembly module TamB n=1 Tax=Rivibacter subsaxonicus TaxID=457575 RepID=A0A4Q7VGX0_9BURK|nr:translocation/assembly module TamB domain-containing protein [Rivibacter subsaxonicus]RZT95306.1 translocation and assembly module TamB [Rivibacter subsaxonicus]
MDERAATPGDPVASTPAPRWRSGWRWLFGLLGGLVALVLLAGAGLVLSLRTETGTRWWVEQAVGRMPGIDVSGIHGTLLGGDGSFGVGTLRIDTGGTRVYATELAWSGLRLRQWQRQAPFVAIELESLRARTLDIAPAKADPKAPRAKAPTSLALPVQARVERLQVDRLTIAGLDRPFEGIGARVELGAVHRVEQLALRWNGLAASGSAQIGASGPLPLQAQIEVRALPAAAPAGAGEHPAPPTTLLPAWAKGLELTLGARGPLAGFDASAALALEGQRLDAEARVTPFAAAPLSGLDARFAQLDLQPLAALLGASAPQTRLDGELGFQFDAAEPLVLRAAIDNGLPGRWDAGRLPLARLELDARGGGRDWQIERGDARLAGAGGVPAGRLSVSGSFALPERSAEPVATPPAAAAAASRWPTGDLRFTLDGVALPQLDARAPSLQLSGPLRLEHAAPTAAEAAFGTVRLQTQLRGTLLGEAARRAPAPLRAGPVRFETTAELDPRRLHIERLLAATGPARLEGSALLREAGGGRWSGDGRLQLSDFDPSLWLPGDASGAWRQARNSLDGELEFRASAPRPGAGVADWLALLEGSAKARLGDDSWLGGVRLQADAQAEADGRGGVRASAAARAAGNQLDASLLLLPRGSADTQAEQLLLTLDAPAIGRTGALTRALGQPDLSGRVFLKAEARGGVGAWLLPARGAAADATSSASTPLLTRGTVELDDLRSKGLRVQKLRGRWEATLPPARAEGLDALGQAALKAELRGDQISLPALTLPVLALRLDGSLAEHEAKLRAVLAPPASDEAPPPDVRPLVLDATARGNWSSSGEEQRWALKLPQLLLRPLSRDQARAVAAALPAATKPATTPPAATGSASAPLASAAWPPLPAPPAAASKLPATPLLLARDLEFLLQNSPERLQWSVAPGRAELAGATLGWSALQGERQAGAAPTFDVSAELEPFEVATVLRRFQPDFGWAGDLRVGGRLELHARPEVSLKLELARTGGDLQLSDFGGVRSLGLEEALVKVVAENGQWQLTQRLNGSYLGRVEADLAIAATPLDLVPRADARIEGQLRAQVESLAAWAIWVPAGWRLGGQLDAALQVSGTVGAPRILGTVRGRDMVLRNTLEGVDLRDGTLELDFRGETVELTTLRFKAGEGTLEATGSARTSPEASVLLDFAARHATVLGRVDRRIVISGDAQVRLAPNKVALRGRLEVDEGLIDISRFGAPRLGDDVVVKRAGDDPDAAVAVDAAAAQRSIDLDLVVNAGQNLQLRGHGLDARLAGEIRLTAPRNALRATGEIRTESGRFEAYGQRLTIERGVISFAGDVANPLLDIEAIRPNLDDRVGVRVTGTVNAPRIRLFSEPEKPDTEVLALLITGRPYDSLGGTDMLIMQRAALALLAGEGGAGGLFRTMGFDTFSVSQSDGATRDTIVAIGRQLSDRVYVGYRRGINASSGTWELTYRIANRFTLRAQSGDESALDLIWIFRWD